MNGIRYNKGAESRRGAELELAIPNRSCVFPWLPASVVRVLPAFTLIELLITVAIIALLLSILAPALRGTIAASRTAKCLANQRQLALAWSLYANDYHDRAVPAAYWQAEYIGSGPVVYWFGADSPDAAPSSGTLMPYIATARAERSALECPEQAAGTYTPQTQNLKVSTTYGYNGYYLSPAMTPGWAGDISFRPWRRTADITMPSELLVFADTLLAGVNATALPRSTALLDPPMLYSQNAGWQNNSSPTTAFRHGVKFKANVAARADGSAAAATASQDLLQRDSKGRALGTGNLSKSPDPGYVPDWNEWKN
ncbi:MAG: prepilin-type N-terminal cleavage/methylation domain-containing protein [Phycisphaeraceae bacterium]|nr:prepilin-type N-terminal cleavage/methylation domain-containing protein [Phycisphaeraceae bacterium]